MIDTGYQVGTEDFAVGHHAADRHAAEIHAVIALLATDQAGTITFAARTVVAQRDLQRGVDRLGAGVREKAVEKPSGAISMTRSASSNALSLLI